MAEQLEGLTIESEDNADTIINLMKTCQHCGAGQVYMPYDTIGQIIGRALALRYDLQRAQDQIDEFTANKGATFGAGGDVR